MQVAGHPVSPLQQWDWAASLTRNFWSRVAPRVRVNYLLNWVLFVAAVLVLVSGMLISQNVLPTLGLSSQRTAGGLIGFWHQMHTLSASAMLILASLHLGLNWRWIVNACKQIFGVGGSTRGAGGPSTRRPIDTSV